MFAVGRRVAFTTFLMLFAHAAAANTTFCVTNDANGPSKFDTAMTYWTNAVNETVYVHLEQGTYSILNHPGAYAYSGIGTGYEQDGGNYAGSGNATLHLVGGFVPGTNCASRVVNASNTTIHGDASAGVRVFELMQTQGSLLIDGLSFDVESGVVIHPNATAVTVRNVKVSGVTDNSIVNDTGAALSFFAYSGSSGNSFVAQNVLVYRNSVAGLYVISGSSGDTAQIVNSTIVDNGGYGIGVGVPSDSYRGFSGTIKAYNLIARGNASDITVASGSTTPVVDNSDYQSHSGPIGGGGNVNVDPLFVNELGNNFDLQTTSPVINKGALASSVSGGYPGTDIRGRTRVIGSRVDMGAYESVVDDTSNQVVTKLTDDTGAGTLRTAITAANGNANATTITFNIPGGTCPQTVQILSALPDITSDITIDGYTQPGAAANTTAPGYNGTVCVVFDGFTQDYGLHVTGNGRLTVRGIDFERFTKAAVHLSAGSDNEVTGNTFQNDSNYTQAGQVGVLIDGTASASQIGNYAFGDRNVFNRWTDSGVKILNNTGGGNNIVGNYFGYKPDGSIYSIASSQRNGYGVFVSGSGTNFIGVNYIGGSIEDGIYLGGVATTANTVSGNALGLGPDGSTFGNGQGACGGVLCLINLPSIEIVAGAHDNVIGEAGCVAGLIGANTITGNYGPGVALPSNAGANNSVCGNNLIYANNGYPAIDLGYDGPTPNDLDDPDTGPNNLQNYPVLYQAYRIEPTVARISGYLYNLFGTAQGYHIDVYWSDACTAGDSLGQRGELKRYIGFTNVFASATVHGVFYVNVNLIAASGVPKTGYLSAIATDPNGNTSEVGTCTPLVDDYIFTDGFGH